MKFNEFARNGRNFNGDAENMEIFEDTHGNQGAGMPNYSQTPTMKQMSDTKYNVPNFSNFVLFKPVALSQVQEIIDCLKDREPAVVNLENAEPAVAQRILDFVSGATYALCGSVYRVERNIFLISPEGVGITVPYESK